MGKISPISIKYIVRAKIFLTGVVEKPDVIGAIFGQTEGLLGSDLELREVQKSGRIGRIDVNIESKGGKSVGEIIVPSSMSKTETAIIAAALETIERVGPCDAKITVIAIEDVRISKRKFILDRAKELLREMVRNMPDSQDITNKVTENVRTMEISEYGKDRLPAGPAIDEADDILIVEGRADVLNLLRYGIRNGIALDGDTAKSTLINLSKKKVTTIFIDGDRGGDLILKKIADVAEWDYVAKAPEGKEVEELTQKELLKTLRAKITWEQAKSELGITAKPAEKLQEQRPQRDTRRPSSGRQYKKPEIDIPKKDAKIIKQLSEELIGTHGVFVLDETLNILGKIPAKEINESIQDMSDDIYALVVDGSVDSKIVKLAESKNIKLIIGKTLNAKSNSIVLLTTDEL